MKNYDVIVVGGGHAGIEASLASARLGANTLLITQSITKIGLAPCNPAIGGPAKGIVVREIDALGGEMGLNTDKTMLQMKELNSSKGPAVRAYRAQIDKQTYPLEIQKTIQNQQGLTILESLCDELIIEDQKCLGIIAQSQKYFAKTVVITTGTYMTSNIIWGEKNLNEGPEGQKTSSSLSQCLKKHQVELFRLKTGTPPRLEASSIDFTKCTLAPGDTHRQDSFSFLNKHKLTPNEQHPCYLTYTNDKTHQIIQDNIKLSPMYNAKITSTGPRYCPSIEDKVMRFKDKARHQIFLEPESASLTTIYVQGMSTSMPHHLQAKFLKTIPGLEKCEIVKYGYAIEYDVINPIQLKNTLEFKKIPNLFSAGQINGTSGYEEAAGQGLIAGINAAQKAKGLEQLILTRENSYIGLMIDDIVGQGVTEPYRLLTSRSEYRLVLRNDNADQRLTPIGRKIGLISDERFTVFTDKTTKLQAARKWINTEKVKVPHRAHKLTIYELLKSPEINFEEIAKYTQVPYQEEILNTLSVEVKYEGYIKKIKQDISKQSRFEKYIIPPELNYSQVKNLTLEAVEKLTKIKPLTIGQATRIPGVTAVDISMLLIHLKNK